MDLDGARALVTGASRGIGAAIARRLVDSGAEVILVARSAEAVGRLAEDLEGTAIAGDLLDPDFVAELPDRAGPIDVLVNNAGIERADRVVDVSPQDLEDVFRLNLVVPAQLCSMFLPAMVARGRGHIVNMSSLSMAVDTPGWASYSASKAGLSSFTESLRVELDGIRIGLTAVEIGFTETDMVHNLLSEPLTAPTFERALRLRLQRMLEPEEVARAVVRAVERDRSHVRLPRRTAALPALANVGRRASRLMAPKLPPS